MSNPALNNRVQEKFMQSANSYGAMTISGTVLKTLFLFAILLTSAFYTFSLMLNGFTDKAMMFHTVGLIGGFITAFVIIFSRNEKILAPLTILYSALEGFFIGGISAYFAGRTNLSLVINAVLATFVVLVSMLFLYSAKIIKCTERFKSIVMLSTFSICIIYLVTFIMGFFNPAANSILTGSGSIGILFSIFVCVTAASNLIIDFHIIENAKNLNLSKSFEWYGAFSLMVTLIWLYIEVLRFLSKLSSRN